jgi:hypothetical protein
LRLTLAQRDHGRRATPNNCNPFFDLEVLMSGRRSHPRFAVVTPWDGAIRVLRGVVVERTEQDGLYAVSQAPGIAGEEMTLDLMGAGATLGLRVRVIDSRPVMVEGSVRHQIRLEVVSDGMATPNAEQPFREAAAAEAVSAEAV